MRITIAARASTWGGMEVHTSALARELAARGHDVVLMPLGVGVYEPRFVDAPSGVRLAPQCAAGSSGSVSFLRWHRMLRENPGDVCIFAKNYWNQSTIGFNLASWLSFRRLLYIEHVPPGRTPKNRTRRGWQRFVPSLRVWELRTRLKGIAGSLGVDRIICVSNEVRSALWDECRVPRWRLRTVHNGTNPDLFRPDPVARTTARASWGVPHDAIVCGAVTRIENGSKRLDLMLRAFAEARALQPEIDLWLVIVGDGPDRDSLETQARMLGVGDRVHLAPFSHRPWSQYPGLDIFLITSRFEAISLALIEAMACGCYPIGFRVGGIPEVLDSEVGALIDDGDEQGLARALASAAALATPARGEVAARARARIVATFDSRRTYAKIATLVEGAEV